MRWRAGVATVIVLLLPLTSSLLAQSDVRVLFARAETLERAGNHDAALPLLDQVIERLDAIGDGATPQTRLLLQRSLIYRATARWETRQRDDLDADLDRIIDMDPRFDLEQQGVPEGLVSRFRKRRDRRVGYLQVAVNPADARLRVDGKVVSPVPEILPVLAGEHVLVANKPGFATARQRVKVRSNRTEGVGLVLQRASTTIRLATSPVGATVKVDGEVVGTSVGREPDAEVSDSMLVQGLLPGTHEIEVQLRDYRSFRQRVDLPDLADYDLGTVRLSRALGRLELRGLTGAAEVRVDGVARDLEWRSGGPPVGAATSSARLAASVGDHALAVSDPGVGVFETRVSVLDGETTAIDVTLRPGIALLGVVGGDELEQQSVQTAIDRALAAPGNWFPLRRDGTTAALLRAAGLPPRRAWQDGLELLAAADWDSLRQTASDRTAASLYVLAVVSDTAVGEFDLLVWSGDDRMPEVWVGRAATDEPGALGQLVAALANPLPPAVAWFGATVIDSALTGHPTVISVVPGGPAADSGLRVGDELMSLDGVPMARTAELHARVAGSPPFVNVTLQYGRGADLGTARVTLESSPQVREPGAEGIAAVTWAATRAALARPQVGVEVWVLQSQAALMLLDAGQFEEAARLLAGIHAPEDAPFGAGAVAYWYGVALSSGPDADPIAAREALLAAADVPGARLFHNEGPLVAPRARARLALLRAQATSS